MRGRAHQRTPVPFRRADDLAQLPGGHPVEHQERQAHDRDTDQTEDDGRRQALPERVVAGEYRGEDDQRDAQLVGREQQRRVGVALDPDQVTQLARGQHVDEQVAEGHEADTDSSENDAAASTLEQILQHGLSLVARRQERPYKNRSTNGSQSAEIPRPLVRRDLAAVLLPLGPLVAQELVHPYTHLP